MPARPHPAARATIYNETLWPITVLVAGQPGVRGARIAPGGDAAVTLGRAGPTALVVAAQGRVRSYDLDLGLLGFDTVHVRPDDLAANEAR